MTKYITSLLSQVGAKNIIDLSIEELKTIFLIAIRDFKDGKITLDELSLFASEIVQIPQASDDQATKEVKDAIYACSEIGYYLRQIPEVDKGGKNTISFLLQTMEYYQKNKEFLE